MVFAAGNDLLGYWPFGQAYCQFWVSFDIVCSTASILNLCAISLDRYWHISRPMVYVRCFKNYFFKKLFPDTATVEELGMPLLLFGCCLPALEQPRLDSDLVQKLLQTSGGLIK